MGVEKAQFFKVRSFFWPIHRNELVKFIPMIFIFFCIAFNYHLLKIIKDTLIITQKHSGAEAIPFLKVWIMLPTAIFMTFLFTRTANRVKRQNIFHVMSLIFLLFFIIFLFFLYPNYEKLALDSFADTLQASLPKGFKGLIAIIRYWVFSLFYVMAESWSIIMVSVVLWGFANDVTKIDQAKRFYPLFGVGKDSSGIIAGYFGQYLTTKMHTKSISIKFLSFFGKSDWDQTLAIFILLVIFVTIISMILYKVLNQKLFKDHYPSYKTKVEKPKMSLRKNIKYVAKSKYLLYIAIIVLSYNLTNNLTEVLWKAQVKEYLPNACDFTAYMSKVTTYIGIIATLISFLVTGNVIRYFGWKLTALLTPILVLGTSIGFFYFIFLKQYFIGPSVLITILGMTPLALAAFFGSFQNILTRAAKYTVFDDSKELAFIPLSLMDKIRGKSAIDGLGSRVGKSGSSLIMQMLLLFFATPSLCSPIIFVLILVIMPVWFYAISKLNKKFTTYQETHPKEELTLEVT